MAASRVVFERLAIATVVGTLILILLGGYVKATHAGLSCPDWPKCYGVWFPFGDNAPVQDSFSSDQIASEWLHRYVASMVGPMILAMAAMSWFLKPVERGIRFFATAALLLLPIQIGFGGLTVLKLLQPIIVTSHLGFATLIFGALVVATTLALASPHRSGRAPADAPAPAATTPATPDADADEPVGAAPGHMSSRPWTARLQQTFGPWFELIKPGILFLLVLCGAAGMFLAGRPSGSLIWFTLVGGGLAAASAAAFNNYLDRDRDGAMARTKKRSIPSARVQAHGALVFAFALEIASFAILWRYVNLVAAVCALGGILFYVYYTVWLKPSTVQNIVIGGAAGAAPALVGWAAVTGTVSWEAVLLGSIIFTWTPPHFWALALVYKNDYAKGVVPMFPVVKGDAATHRQILFYAVLTLVATLLFVPMGTLSWVYGVIALILGGWFVALAVKLLIKKDNKTAYGLFAYSIVYLALLFGAMVIDRLVSF